MLHAGNIFSVRIKEKSARKKQQLLSKGLEGETEEAERDVFDLSAYPKPLMCLCEMKQHLGGLGALASALMPNLTLHSVPRLKSTRENVKMSHRDGVTF